jgi:hypothetical protein
MIDAKHWSEVAHEIDESVDPRLAFSRVVLLLNYLPSDDVPSAAIIGFDQVVFVNRKLINLPYQGSFSDQSDEDVPESDLGSFWPLPHRVQAFANDFQANRGVYVDSSSCCKNAHNILADYKPKILLVSLHTIYGC